MYMYTYIRTYQLVDDEAEDEDFEGMETVQVGEHVMGIKTSALEEKATACHMLVRMHVSFMCLCVYFPVYL